MSVTLTFKNSINIGIVGPRPFLIGGYDSKNPIRIRINKSIKHILEYYSNKYRVIGNTGLLHGAELDFAEICDNLNLRFNAFLPCDKQEEMWPEDSNYSIMLDKASKIIKLSTGRYSPKKNQNKIRQIINKSDIIIYIMNPLLKKNEYIISSLNDKKIFVIYYDN